MTSSRNNIVKKLFLGGCGRDIVEGSRSDYIGDTNDNYWQIETLKSDQENVKVSLSVRRVGEILALFSVKNIF